MKGGGREEAVFNMCNALMQRIHQSGHLAEIPEEDFTLVKEALDYYKTTRGDIKRALPFWPLGTSHFADTWVSLALKPRTKRTSPCGDAACRTAAARCPWIFCAATST